MAVFLKTGPDAVDHINAPNVNLADLQKYLKNARLKTSIKKYLFDEYQAGSTSQPFLQKAENLLLYYADVVFTEDELLSMRQEVKILDKMLEDSSLLNLSSKKQGIQ
jgi:hypothetical protein